MAKFRKLGSIQDRQGHFTLLLATQAEMQAAGYSCHHESKRYLIMANGTRAFAIRKKDVRETEEEYTRRTQQDFSSALLESVCTCTHNGYSSDVMESSGGNTLYAFSHAACNTFARIFTLLGIPYTMEEQDECWKFTLQPVEYAEL